MKIECPKCHNLLEVDSTWCGQKAECPYCQNNFEIPLCEEANKSNIKTAFPQTKDNVKKHHINWFSIVQAVIGLCQTAVLFGILILLYRNMGVVNPPGAKSESNQMNVKKTDDTANNIPQMYIRAAKNFNLGPADIELLEKQPTATEIYLHHKHEKLKLTVGISLKSDFPYRKRYYKESHYCIRIYYLHTVTYRVGGENYLAVGYAYVKRDSQLGKRLFEKLKDEHVHMATLDIELTDLDELLNQDSTFEIHRIYGVK